jgi:hypothetical protein
VLVSNRTEPIEKIVIHTNQGPERDGSARDLVRYLASIVGGYHEVVDNKEEIKCARDDQVVAGAKGMNARGYHICGIGYAEQTRAQWEDSYSAPELVRLSARTAAACQRFGIPATHLPATPSAMGHGVKGICGHRDVSDAIVPGGHWDPGPPRDRPDQHDGFPWDTFMALVQQIINVPSPGGGTDVRPSDRVDGFKAKNGGATVVHADGGVFAYGSEYHGSVPALGITLVMGVNHVVSVMETASGKGYWMLGQDGGIFSFGDAPFAGSGTGLSKYACQSVELVPNDDPSHPYGIVYECVVQPTGGILVPS